MMHTILNGCAILGLVAFVYVLRLETRVQKLERSLRSETSEPAEIRTDLHEQIEQYIGQSVTLDFYEGEEDMDILSLGKKSTVTILESDGQWMLVRLESPAKRQQKLLRTHSIKSIGTITTT